MKFTEKELQLIYTALMCYGNLLANDNKKYTDDEIISLLANKAHDSWDLARKICEIKEKQ